MTRLAVLAVLALLAIPLAASSALADSARDQAQWRGTTEIYLFLDGGYGVLDIDSIEEVTPLGETLVSERATLRLGHALGHLELRRWSSSLFGGRFVLTAGGGRGDYRFVRSREVVESQSSAFAAVGASVGAMLGRELFILAASMQYLYIRPRSQPEMLGDFELTSDGYSTLGAELRAGLRLPAAVELTLLARVARVLQGDGYYAFGVAVLFRLFRHDSRPVPAGGPDW